MPNMYSAGGGFADLSKQMDVFPLQIYPTTGQRRSNNNM